MIRKTYIYTFEETCRLERLNHRTEQIGSVFSARKNMLDDILEMYERGFFVEEIQLRDRYHDSYNIIDMIDGKSIGVIELKRGKFGWGGDNLYEKGDLIRKVDDMLLISRDQLKKLAVAKTYFDLDKKVVSDYFGINFLGDDFKIPENKFKELLPNRERVLFGFELYTSAVFDSKTILLGFKDVGICKFDPKNNQYLYSDIYAKCDLLDSFVNDKSMFNHYFSLMLKNYNMLKESGMSYSYIVSKMQTVFDDYPEMVEKIRSSKKY